MYIYMHMLSLVNKHFAHFSTQNQALILRYFTSHHLSICKAEFKMLSCCFGNNPLSFICTGGVKQGGIRTWNFRVCQFRKLSGRNMCPSAPMWEWTWTTNTKFYLHCGLLSHFLGCINPVQGQISFHSEVWMKSNFTNNKIPNQGPPEREMIQTHLSSRIFYHALQDRQKTIINLWGLCHGLVVQEL